MADHSRFNKGFSARDRFILRLFFANHLSMLNPTLIVEYLRRNSPAMAMLRPDQLRHLHRLIGWTATSGERAEHDLFRIIGEHRFHDFLDRLLAVVDDGFGAMGRVVLTPRQRGRLN